MTEGLPRVEVIAEAGVNHDGLLDRALALVDVAADAGADTVKFQTFRASALVSRRAPKAEYQERSTGAGSQLAMLSRLELRPEDHHVLVKRCEERGIAFLSSPFDVESARFLTEDLGLTRLKLGSGELTNGPLLLRIARLARSVILSTGMSTLGEVEEALSVLAWGYARADSPPSRRALGESWADPQVRASLRDRVTLLHCTTEYPAPVEEANLRAMDTLRVAFGLPIGFSDHTEGIVIPQAAVARGAVVIEKHFTLDRGLPGPDHAASLEPSELKAMVDGIRRIESALGDGAKVPAPSERKNVAIARKSLVASTAVRVGERWTEDKLTTKRPGGGASPMAIWEVLGTIAERAYDEDEALDAAMVRR